MVDLQTLQQPLGAQSDPEARVSRSASRLGSDPLWPTPWQDLPRSLQPGAVVLQLGDRDCPARGQPVAGTPAPCGVPVVRGTDAAADVTPSAAAADLAPAGAPQPSQPHLGASEPTTPGGVPGQRLGHEEEVASIAAAEQESRRSGHVSMHDDYDPDL